MVRDTNDHRRDALIEQGHGCRTVDEVGEGLNQLLPETRLQRGQSTKLRGKTM